MDFIPNSEVRLLSNVPLSINNNNQLYFDTISQQRSYFINQMTKYYPAVTYQRKERGIFYCKDVADDLWNVNYMMFKNTNFGNKDFYAFVTKIEYIDPNCTAVHFEIDCFQTWLFDIQFKDSFIEREHTLLYQSTGVPVINTVDEGLNYGNTYKAVGVNHFTLYGNTKFILFISKEPLHKASANPPAPSVIGGVPNSLYYYILPFDISDMTATYGLGGLDLLHFREFYLKLITNKNFVGKVVSIQLMDFLPLPNVKVDNTNHIVKMDGVSGVNPLDSIGLTGKIIYVSDNQSLATTTVSCGNKYNGIPLYAESKLLMYPYSFAKISDYRGNEFEIHLEYVQGNTLQVKVEGSIAPQNKTAYEVNMYSGYTSMDNAIVNTSDESLPIVDDYTASYMQSNRNSLTTSVAFGLLNALMGTGANLATGNIGGAVDTGLSEFQDITMLNAKLKDINNHPDTLRSMGNNANFDYGNQYDGFYVVWYTIQDEYVNILTDYFKKFGVKVNRVKKPNLHTRQSWNYVKTVNCTITGSIPLDDLQRVRDIFNRGVTLWHTPSHVGDYSQNNSPL